MDAAQPMETECASIETAPVPAVTVAVGFAVRTNTGAEVLATESVFQYVDLPVNDGSNGGYDDIIKDRHRQGPQPRILVRFSVPGVRTFTITSEHKWGGAPYQDTGHASETNEVARNGKFRHVALRQTLTTAADGTCRIDAGALVLPASGGDRFRLEVQSDGVSNAVSQVLTTRRFLAILLTVSPDADAGVIDRRRVKSELAKAGIHAEFVTVDPCTAPVTFNTDTRETTRQSGATLSALYDRSLAAELAGHVVEMVVVKNLARPRIDEITKSVNSRRKDAKKIAVAGRTDASPVVASRSLWSPIDPRGWFVGGTFTPDVGGPVAIRPEQCRPSRNHKSVLVTLDSTQVGKGRITLQVKYAAELVLGFNLMHTNLIVVSTHMLNAARPAERVNRTVIHEIGHALGMVVGPPNWQDSAHRTWWTNYPNRSQFHYTIGGSGPHCYAGMRFSMGGYRSRGDEARCVMYESSCAELSYCPACIATMRKLDLSGGNLPLYHPVG